MSSETLICGGPFLKIPHCHENGRMYVCKVVTMETGEQENLFLQSGCYSALFFPRGHRLTSGGATAPHSQRKTGKSIGPFRMKQRLLINGEKRSSSDVTGRDDG